MPINRSKLKEIVPRELLTDEQKKERKRVHDKRYCQENKESIRISQSEYKKIHKEEINSWRREWNKLPQRKAYSREHRDKRLFLGVYGEGGFSIQLVQKINKYGKIAGLVSIQDIRTPEENKLRGLKHKFKNVTMLNEPFEGCEGHHMLEDVIIFIPKELHQSVWHNLKTGKNMDEINGKAQIWFGGQLAG